MLTWVSEPEPGITQINVQRFINDQWQSPEAIYNSRELNYSPSIGSNKAGDIMVVWAATSTVRSVLRAMVYRNGEWSSSEIVANQGGRTTTPAIIFDRSNNAHVVWVSDSEGLDDIYRKQWIASTNQWTDVVKVNSDNDIPDILPELELSQDGDVLVMWRILSLETKNFVDMTKIVSPSGNQLDGIRTELNRNKLPELSYSQVPLPKEFAGAAGAAVMHFPDNDYIQYQKLPRGWLQ